MPLSPTPTRRTLPRPAKVLLTAYLAATKRQIRVAGSRFMRAGEAAYPFLLPGGAAAVAHMRDRMIASLGHHPTAVWYEVARDAARLATIERFGLPRSKNRIADHDWPQEARAADLALQAALLTAIAEYGGATFDDDVRQWLVGRWITANLGLNLITHDGR